jgi:acyl-coenzyme A synthetase/AMP-(fatty) acid ligase
VDEAAATEGVAAYVVPRSGGGLATADVRRWVRDGMADYATPRWVHFVDQLPRNATGKLDKPSLRADAAERAAARRPPSAG